MTFEDTTKGLSPNLYVRLFADAIHAYLLRQTENPVSMNTILWPAFGKYLLENREDNIIFMRFYSSLPHRLLEHKGKNKSVTERNNRDELEWVKENCLQSTTVFRKPLSHARRFFKVKSDTGTIDTRVYDTFIGLSLAFGVDTKIEKEGTTTLCVLEAEALSFQTTSGSISNWTILWTVVLLSCLP